MLTYQLLSPDDQNLKLTVLIDVFASKCFKNTNRSWMVGIL